MTMKGEGAHYEPKSIQPDFVFINENSSLLDDESPQASDYPAGRVVEDNTVLVVEDNDLVLRTILDLLKGENFPIIATADGNEAMAIFKAHHDKIALAILDDCIPGISGLDLARSFRTLSDKIRVILTSGYYGDDLRGPGIDPSYATFLQKPFRVDTLLRTVRDYMDEPRSA